MRYPVIIHKDPDSDYGVTVPDAKQHGETRSRFIAQAAMEFIASHSTTE